MLFSDLEYGFQEAFLAAWNSFKRGSLPAGCAIIDNDGILVARGENSIYAKDKNEVITGHRLAHAELNAILKVNGDEHPNIGSYTLYATMEPCALCYGAIVHNHIKKVKFAMRDNQSGAKILNEEVDRFQRQGIQITGPAAKLEVLAVTLIVYRRLRLGFSHNETFFRSSIEYSPAGLEIGYFLHGDSVFNDMVRDNVSPIKIFDYILQKFT